MPEGAHRHQLIELLTPLAPAYGAEIGVQAGRTAAELLRAFPSLRMYLVDRWAPPEADSPYYRSGDTAARRTVPEYRKLLLDTLSNTDFAGNRRTIIAADSLTAAELVRDTSLDFAFIDADHTHDAVLADCRAWWVKLRHGGMLAIHDYENPSPQTQGVKPAVDSFAGEVGAVVNVEKGFVAWVDKRGRSPR
jgi:hypothetical protein